MSDMDEAARAYVDAIAAEHRPLFDRVHRLILTAHPDATVGLSYQMPTYTVGGRRLYVGVWRHGVSLYGWAADRSAGFTNRHPELVAGKGTIQLRAEQAAGIPDAELLELVRGVLDP